MIFCKDCRHLRGEYCHSPNNRIELVHGEPQVRLADASRADNSLIGHCFSIARFFEPKKPFWKFL
jgi:hypothetical protein